MIRLDIFADPVCPWCLIGKARLDRALEARPNHPFVIAWHPFQLNPAMPAGGMPRPAAVRAWRKGQTRWIPKVAHARLVELADTLALGASARKGVSVRVRSRALVRVCVGAAGEPQDAVEVVRDSAIDNRLPGFSTGGGGSPRLFGATGSRGFYASASGSVWTNARISSRTRR